MLFDEQCNKKSKVILFRSTCSINYYLPYSAFTSLVEEVEFICENWVDPESIGIKSYLLFSTDVTTNVKNTIKRTNNLYSH